MNPNSSIKVWLSKTRGKMKRRIELHSGEVQRFDGAGQNIRVLSGRAQIRVNGQDIPLSPGHMLQLPSGHYPVVISTLKHTPLIYEIRG
jgi:hypothetical protein